MKMIGWLVLAVAAGGVAQAKPKTPLPPADVTAAVQSLVLEAWPQPDPDDPNDHPPPPPPVNARTIRGWLKAGVLRPVKVSPGRGSDWRIDTERLYNLGAYFCGTGGCEQQIWSPSGDGHYTKVFDSQVREMRFHWIKGKAYTWIEVDYHGAYCGTFGAAACPWGYEWDGHGLATSWRFAHGDVMRPGSLISPLDNDDERARAPADIRVHLQGLETACKAKAREVNLDGVVGHMPDLNSDGIEDWSYDGGGASCQNADPNANAQDAADDSPCSGPDCVSAIWLSRRENDGGVGWNEVPIAPKGVVGWRYHKASGRAELIEFDNLPGVADDADDACDTYALERCVEVAIPLSPKS